MTAKTQNKIKAIDQWFKRKLTYKYVRVHQESYNNNNNNRLTLLGKKEGWGNAPKRIIRNSAVCLCI